MRSTTPRPLTCQCGAPAAHLYWDLPLCNDCCRTFLATH